MNKQTKMIIGVGVVAVAGYLIWKQQQKTTASWSGGAQTGREKIKNASGTMSRLAAPKCTKTSDPGCGCPPKSGAQGTLANDGHTVTYPNGHQCCGTVLGPCNDDGTPQRAGKSSTLGFGNF